MDYNEVDHRGQSEAHPGGDCIDAVFGAVATFVGDFGPRYPAGRDCHLRVFGAGQGDARRGHAGGRGGAGACVLFLPRGRTHHFELADQYPAALRGIRLDRGLSGGDTAGVGAAGPQTYSQPDAGIRSRCLRRHCARGESVCAESDWRVDGDRT